jgi:hypothetical protein
VTACDYLARIGYEYLLGTPHSPEDFGGSDNLADDDPAAYAACVEAARLADHARVHEQLLSAEPRSIHADRDGCDWVLPVTWPDRVPGLKTWAGNSTLVKVIEAHQTRLRADPAADLFEARGAYRTARGQGPSGIDYNTCRDAVDIGFSPAKLGMDIVCRPAVELLAIVGLETLPLVSYGSRECGFAHAGRLWRFAVETRSGGYYHRWGLVTEVADGVEAYL